MYSELVETDSTAKGTWEARFCPTRWCNTHTLYVKRHAEQYDAWWVTAGEDEHPWLVARKTPICPLCGESLLTAASVGVQQAVLPGSQILW